METNGFLTNIRLLIRPTFVASVIGWIWYFIFYEGKIGVLEADESAITDSFFPVIAMFHSIIAGLALGKLWDKYLIIHRSIREKDKATFDRYKDDRLPVVTYILIGAMSIVVQILGMMIHFEGGYTGLISNFLLTFVLSLYWESVTNLDDPLNGVWYVNQIPKDWVTIQTT